MSSKADKKRRKTKLGLMWWLETQNLEPRCLGINSAVMTSLLGRATYPAADLVVFFGNCR